MLVHVQLIDMVLPGLPYIIVHCSLPLELCNGGIVDYDRLNETVVEGTVLTYQCDNGLSLTGPNTMHYLH